MIKRLICLANSRKHGGRCIAGRELLARNPGEWIRPVSDRENEAVSKQERQYEDGSDPRVLDIIDVPLIGPRSKPHQPENWLLDRGARWSKAREFEHDNLHLLTDPPRHLGDHWCPDIKHLWINGHRTSNGQNDYVPVEETNEAGGSLKMIAVDNLQLHVHIEGEEFGNPRRKVRASFSFGGVNYRLSVTDLGIIG
ncbi:MAG: dual OB domain-containing protein [Pseudonocardiales bacterium]